VRKKTNKNKEKRIKEMYKNKEKRIKEIIMEEVSELDDEGYDKFMKQYIEFNEYLKRIEKKNPDLEIDQITKRLIDLESLMKTMNGFEKKIRMVLKKEIKDNFLLKFSDPSDFYDFSNLKRRK